METTTIKFKGVYLTVIYYYTKAEEQTHDYQGCKEEAEIFAVNHEGDDIINLLSDDMINEIEEEILRVR